MHKTINNICVIMPVFVIVIIGLLLSSSYSSASSTSSTTANASVTVGSACTFTGTVSTAHNAEVPNGTNRTDIGSTVLNTICNDNGGFAIYAVGYSSSEYGNNTMINQADSTITFNTGTSTSGNNSNWSMKLTQVTTGTYATTIDNSFNSYHNVPATYTKVAHRDSVTDASSTNPAVGSSISLTYQTYISGTQAAGTYQGKVKFTMVHPANKTPGDGPITCAANKICYSPNANNTEGTMGRQSVSGNNVNTDLLPTGFSREGYGFAGWSEDQNAADHLSTTTIYGPNETITTKSDHSTNGLSLYAVWIPSAGSLQNWSGCSSLQQGSVTALTDQRDNDTYAVAKLADGKCWMIENLRLESTANGNSDGSLAQGYGTSSTYGNFSGLATAETANFSDSTTANSLYYSGTQSGTASIDIGTTDNPGYRMPRYRNTNISSRASSPTTGNDAIYSYGNYYTWSAAIADTTYYNTTNQSITTTSLCPAGWRLPRGGDKNNESNNDFWSLIVDGLNNGTKPANYDSETRPYFTGTTAAGPVSRALRAYPNNFVYSGGAYGGNINARGSYGVYWSSTVGSSSGACSLYFGRGDYVRPGTGPNVKSYGFTMRCMVGS